MVVAISKTVAAAATPERLTASTKRVSWATIQSKTDNTGTVSIGTGAASDAVTVGYVISNPGDSIVLWSTAGRDLVIDLNSIWIQPSVNGEGVNVLYVQ